MNNTRFGVPVLLALGVLAALSWVTESAAQETPRLETTTEETGPLRPSSCNSRYFAHADGRPIYMVGSHTWNNLVDMDDRYPPHNYDFDRYLDFLEAHQHNLFRLWAWEVPKPDSERYVRRVYAAPQPWLRTGPGTDVTGLAKFDLSKPNEAYFERLRDRVHQAQQRGVYAIVMLFEGWGVQFAPGYESHPFNRANNINDVDYGDDIKAIHAATDPEILAIQQDYLQRVVDAVNEFDNVLFEVANEAHAGSTAWQSWVIDSLRSLEELKTKRHPVGMTAQMGGFNTTLFASGADWISPNGLSGGYGASPQPASGSVVIISDTDHLGGSSVGDRSQVWKNFTRGLQTLFMDRYEPPDSVSDRPYRPALEVRVALGQTRLFAEHIDLCRMVPKTNVSSAGYALASETAILAYEPWGGHTVVDLSTQDAGEYGIQWFDPARNTLIAGGSVRGGAKQRLRAPFDGDAVLYIYHQDTAKPIGQQLEERLRNLARAAERHRHRTLKEKVRAKLAEIFPDPGYRDLVLVFGAGLGIGALFGWTIARVYHRSKG